MIFHWICLGESEFTSNILNNIKSYKHTTDSIKFACKLFERNLSLKMTWMFDLCIISILIQHLLSGAEGPKNAKKKKFNFERSQIFLPHCWD